MTTEVVPCNRSHDKHYEQERVSVCQLMLTKKLPLHAVITCIYPNTIFGFLTATLERNKSRKSKRYHACSRSGSHPSVSHKVALCGHLHLGTDDFLVFKCAIIWTCKATASSIVFCIPVDLRQQLVRQQLLYRLRALDPATTDAPSTNRLIDNTLLGSCNSQKAKL